MQNILILDVGDLFFRTPQIADHLRDEAAAKADTIIKSFNRMGCDAFNIGCYDLAMGKDFLLERQKIANFPFLSANLVDKKTGKLIFRPYVIKETNGLKIGIFGLVTTQVESIQRSANFEVQEPIEVARKLVMELKDKCDLIIALTQLGSQGDVELVRQVPEINIIIGGQGKIGPLFKPRKMKPTRVDHTVILQAHNQGRHLGRLDLTISNKSYDFVDYSEKLEILGQIASVKNRIEQFGQVLDKSSSSSDAKRIGKALKSLHKAEKHLNDVHGSSHYVNTSVILDKNIKADPDIQVLITHYREDMRKIRQERFQKGHRKPFPAQK